MITIDPHFTCHNISEKGIKEVKRKAMTISQKKRTPRKVWYFAAVNEEETGFTTELPNP